MTETATFNQTIQSEVLKGLTASKKTLPSWLFYDENGDRLFQEIMQMPEYYLTNCEFDIFTLHKEAILKNFQQNNTAFNLIEFGAGDGLKTEILLDHFTSKQADFTYKPVDISASVLEQLQERMQKSIPSLNIEPVSMEYFDALEMLNKDRENPMIILFLGSNIGNFEINDAGIFLKKISEKLRSGDKIMLGMDLKKDPEQIRNAYDDEAGITKAFNMNLLTRLNNELGADFVLDSYKHYPLYDPETGTAKSFIVSLEEQDVTFESMQKTIHFDQWELLHVEVSQKFDKTMIEQMAKNAGFTINEYFYDEKNYFTDVIFEKA